MKSYSSLPWKFRFEEDAASLPPAITDSYLSCCGDEVWKFGSSRTTWVAGCPSLVLGWGATFPDVCLSSCRRILWGERALRPLCSGGVQERRHLRQPAHRGLQVRVPPGRVRAALLRDDHQELPPSVLHHLQGAAAALPFHCLPHVSPSARGSVAAGFSPELRTVCHVLVPTKTYPEGHCRDFWPQLQVHRCLLSGKGVGLQLSHGLAGQDWLLVFPHSWLWVNNTKCVSPDPKVQSWEFFHRYNSSCKGRPICICPEKVLREVRQASGSCPLQHPAITWCFTSVTFLQHAFEYCPLALFTFLN